MPPTRLFSFPLLKYSRALDVPRDTDQFTWTHYQQGLSLALDRVRNVQVLKVLHGTAVLYQETVPVQEMIAESEDVIRTMLQLKVQARNEQLPISAIIRRPLFALRYNLPDKNMVRRIQLKFVNVDDFDKVHEHFLGLGLRMSASGERPSTATVSSNGNYHSSSGPSCPPSRLAEISNRPSTAGYMSKTAPKISSPLARFSDSVAEEPPDRTAVARPMPASKTVLVSNSTRRVSRPSSGGAPENSQRPVSSSSSHGRPSSSTSGDHISSISAIEEDSGFPVVPSASEMLSTHRISESLLPPRRELPFARSTPPKSSGSDRPSSRASNAAMGPPPLPGPSLSRWSPSFGQSSVLELDTPFSWPATTENTGEQNLSRPPSRADRPPSRSSLLSPDPKPSPIEKPTRVNSSPASYERPASSEQPSARPLRTLSYAAQNTVLPVHPEVSNEGRVISEILKDVHANTSDNLAGYAAQSDEDRMVTLNDFMMQHIDDDSFITLVEDVSVCWARVGLGLE